MKPSVVQAPVDIWVSGNSGATPIYQIENPDYGRVHWRIEISDYKNHHHWSFTDDDVKPLNQDTKLVDSDEWNCTAFREKPEGYYEMIVVTCINKELGWYSFHRTRGVGCFPNTRDSADIERDGISIYIICDVGSTRIK